jgi:hypothetical protein
MPARILANPDMENIVPLFSLVVEKDGRPTIRGMFCPVVSESRLQKLSQGKVSYAANLCTLLFISPIYNSRQNKRNNLFAQKRKFLH